MKPPYGVEGRSPQIKNYAITKTMNMPKQLVNPFSEKFWEIWELYKEYRKETHGFKFMGVISEQMAIKKVYEVSGGDEGRAIRIVEQTIASGKWSGFYPLKTTTYKENGESKQTTTSKGKSGSDSIEARVTNEFNKRFGGGEQNSDGPHLKAV